ncbi:putative benzoate:H+ symporter BenE [Rhodovulum iodosum]|uniref:Benzoate:H+ symporter BenE n=1 Tax=Rhodovulum iodosum TaxID=68291 RepID=A0ABV3XRX6_9RHOB|nr:putative sulfate/molybdate transporter [Rhodovulum robiginosum]
MDRSFAFDLHETSGAFGDLGTLLPLVIGAVAVGGLAATPVLLGFGVFYIATALVYRVPVPVQPMKAVAAVLLAHEVSAGSVAVAGVAVGAVLLVLGATGWIDRLGRLVPHSVLAGLQLGLGIALALVALRLMGDTPLVSVLALSLLALLIAARRLPATLVFLGLAVAVGWAAGLPGVDMPEGTGAPWTAPSWPGLDAVRLGVGALALPQLSLTLTNAILLTALVAQDLHGERAARVTPRRLCLTSGLANLALAPLGALPMCHGAGGVAAHYRFGARTGGAPLLLGATLLGLALLPGGWGMALIASVPAAALGALLMVTAVQLAASRRLIDCRPSCRPVIAATAAATVLLNPFAGLVVGAVAEAARAALVGRRRPRDRAL